MSYVDSNIVHECEQIIANAQRPNDHARRLVIDVLMFSEYGQNVLSQYGLGLCGFQSRQQHGQTLLTVKVSEEGIPLVAFVTAENTTACMSRFLDLLENERINWTRDKYPWF